MNEECKTCDGSGYYADHDDMNRHGEDGECISCPIQVQCDDCQATGQVNVPVSI